LISSRSSMPESSVVSFSRNRTDCSMLRLVMMGIPLSAVPARPVISNCSCRETSSFGWIRGWPSLSSRRQCTPSGIRLLGDVGGRRRKRRGFRITDTASEFLVGDNQVGAAVGVKAVAARALENLESKIKSRGEGSAPIPKRWIRYCSQSWPQPDRPRPSTLKSRCESERARSCGQRRARRHKGSIDISDEHEAVLSPELAIARSGRVSPSKSWPRWPQATRRRRTVSWRPR